MGKDANDPTNSQNKDESPGDGDGEPEISLDSKINMAVRGQLKKALKPIEEQLAGFKDFDSKIAAAVTKALEGAQDHRPSKEKESKEKSDPQVKLLQEQIDQLKRQNKEEADKRVALEEKTKWSEARKNLAEALEAKDVKGARLAALVSHFVSENRLRWDPESEKFVVSVTRSRAKNAAPEELIYDSIVAGVEDWCKTTEAAEFLPAPKPTDPRLQKQQTVTGQGKKAPKYDAPPVDDAEMARRTAQQLESQGISLTKLNRIL